LNGDTILLAGKVYNQNPNGLLWVAKVLADGTSIWDASVAHVGIQSANCLIRDPRGWSLIGCRQASEFFFYGIIVQVPDTPGDSVKAFSTGSAMIQDLKYHSDTVLTGAGSYYDANKFRWMPWAFHMDTSYGIIWQKYQFIFDGSNPSVYYDNPIYSGICFDSLFASTGGNDVEFDPKNVESGLVQMHADGSIYKYRVYRLTASERGYYVKNFDDSTYICIGNSGTPYLRKINYFGTLFWDLALDGAEYKSIDAIFTSSDGQFIFTGLAGDNKGYIAKLNPVPWTDFTDISLHSGLKHSHNTIQIRKNTLIVTPPLNSETGVQLFTVKGQLVLSKVYKRTRTRKMVVSLDLGKYLPSSQVM